MPRPPQRAVLTPNQVGVVVFHSGSLRTLAHRSMAGALEGLWRSLLVGRHSQRARAADAGGRRVLRSAAHEAGLAALAVVALGVVLAALGQTGHISTNDGGLASRQLPHPHPAGLRPLPAGALPGAPPLPSPPPDLSVPVTTDQRPPGLPYPVGPHSPRRYPSQGGSGLSGHGTDRGCSDPKRDL